MTENDSRNLGRSGEAVAAKYYRQRGYILLNHNYRTRLGELDLVLYKEGLLVFAEVKTRTTVGSIAPADAVNFHKRQRLIQAARQYLRHSPYADAPIRFDVVEVIPSDGVWKVHCVQNAFTE